VPSRPPKFDARAFAACRSILVIEFVTPDDPKFLTTGPGPIDSRAAVIGVSDLAGTDQTFLFTEEALRRILVNNSGWFRDIVFLPSPLATSRRIAVCCK
jgi:hypothetical protein